MAAWKAYWFFVVVFVLILSNSSCEQVDEKATAETTEQNSTQENKTTENVNASKILEEDNVLVLTDKNLHRAVAENKVILVEFYAPWCGHCKQLAPVYAQAAEMLKENLHPVALGKVDSTVETEVAEEFKVQGYPTLILFKNGEPEEYQGERDLSGIVKYMTERSDPDWKPPPVTVITLTKDNFTEVTQREELMLVEFYSQGCGHCKKLAPELERAAQTLQQKHDQGILIAKVDAIDQQELAQQYEVNAYPTMKIFRHGKATEYKGPLEAPGIVSYMLSQYGPPTKLYETINQIKEFMKSNGNEPVFLGVFSDKDDALMKLFIDTNQEVRDEYQFGHTFCKEAKRFFGLKGSAIVVIHPEYLLSKFEPKYAVYSDESGSPSEVREFYRTHHIPLVGHYQQHVDHRFSKRPLVLVFYDVNFEHQYRTATNYWRNKVLNVAKDYPDILFAVAEEVQFTEKLQELELSESSEDVNVGLYDDQNHRYAMQEEEFSEDSLIEFLESYKQGKLKPIIKSQRIAPRAKSGQVQVLVGKSFDDIVMDESKEVFIEFYAPWCGHCKAIENVIVELAKKYKGEKDIVIAKIDGTANETPKDYKVGGFPTIYYALPGKKNQPIKQSGPRDKQSLIKFIEDNSVVLKNKGKKEKTKEEL